MHYIGIDLGGTFTKAATMERDGEIICQWKVPSQKADWNDFQRMLDELILPNREGLAGIAVSMPGMIDPQNGIAISAGSFPFLQKTPLRQILEDRYGVPSSIANDSKCAALAECWKGSMQGVTNGLVYVIGTAIGGGIIVNGEVVIGPHFLAGELSNCLQNLNSPGFSRENIAARKGGAYGMLLNYQRRTGAESMIDGKEFFNRVAAGEPEANEIFSEFCRFTASFFMTLQMILDMERIAIGGGISAQPVVVAGIRKELEALYSDLGRGAHAVMPMPQVVRCRFGNDSNLIGALKYLLKRNKED